MVKKVEAWQSNNGLFFSSKKEAEEFDKRAYLTRELGRIFLDRSAITLQDLVDNREKLVEVIQRSDSLFEWR
jgi:hypothetical protein